MRRFALAALFFSLTAFVGVPDAVAENRRTAVVEVIDKTRDAIVNLRTLRVIPARLEQSDGGGRVRGLGTGVIIDPRGYLVTNFHVIENVDQIRVLTSHGKEYNADIVNSDPQADLTVLRLRGGPNESFKYLPLWGGEAILGETVIAIGNPYGLENSVTTGIISAIGRELKLPNGEVFNDLIQTDASINPGNSGGPLLTINGDLLGINVAIRSNAQGIGFVIPTRQVRAIVERLMESRESSDPVNGLTFASDSTAASHATDQILRVNVQPDSPAAKIGFLPDDRLLSVDGQPVKMRFDIRRILWDRKPGEQIRVKVVRDGKETELALKVVPGNDLSDENAIWAHLGVRVQKVSPESVKKVWADLNGGLLLTEVTNDSPAAAAGWQVGDILIGLHEYETVEPANIRFVMRWKDLSKNQPIKFHLIRDGKLMPNGKFEMPAEPQRQPNPRG